MADEIKNFREAVEKFDELLTDFEVLRKQIDESLLAYRSADGRAEESARKMSEILRSVNTLQINAESAANVAIEQAKKAAQEAQALQREMSGYVDELVRQLDQKIKSFKIDTKAIESAISKQVKRINITPVEASIDRLVKASDKGADIIDANRQKIVADINDITASAKEHRKQLRQLVNKQEQILEEVEKRKREIAKAANPPKIAAITLVVAFLIGLFSGGFYIKLITDKPVVTTKYIYQMPEMRKYATKDGYIRIADIRKIAEKYDPAKTSFIWLIPTWVWIGVFLMAGFVLFLILE